MKKEINRIEKQPRMVELLQNTTESTHLDLSAHHTLFFKIFFFMFIPFLYFLRDYITYIILQYFFVKDINVNFLVLRRIPSAFTIVRELISRFALVSLRTGK